MAEHIEPGFGEANLHPNDGVFSCFIETTSASQEPLG